MNWDSIKQLRQRLALKAPAVTAPFVAPTAVVEVQPGFVAGMRLASKTNVAGHRLRSIGIAGLEAGALLPLVNESNIANPAELSRALQAVNGIIANGTGRVALLLPDGAVRVSILSFETLPQNRKEAQALLRWRMKEVLPFPLEEARISHQVVVRDASRIEVLAIAAKSSVLAEYERVMEQVSGCPALVLPATLGLLALLPECEGAQLVIHPCSGSITTAVTAGDRVRLWRTRRLGELDSNALLRQAHAEAARVIASSRDHLKVEISRIWLCDRPPSGSEFCAALSQALGEPVQPLKPDPELGAALSGEDRTLFESFGAPAAGLVLNGP
jgi:hypothetical protein